jgi:hypothetical protein
VELYGSDYDNDPLTFYVIKPPQNGNLSRLVVPAGETTLKYTPETLFEGSDAFTYLINDGTVNSTTQYMVNITVLPPRRAAVPSNINLINIVGEKLYYDLKAESPDTPLRELTWYLLSNPKLGYAAINAENLTLTYEAVNTGDEYFEFRVVDRENNGNIAKVSGYIPRMCHSLTYLLMNTVKELSWTNYTGLMIITRGASFQ